MTAKTVFHERKASFCSSVHSNDSVFTDAEFTDSVLQTDENHIPSGQPDQINSMMDCSKSTSCSAEFSSVQASATNILYSHSKEQNFMGRESDVFKQGKNRSLKDSGYGSRLDTDDFQSPPVSSSDKSSPFSTASSTKHHANSSTTKNDMFSSTNDDTFQILNLAGSPALVGKSYHQFYYADNNYPFVNSSTTPNESPQAALPVNDRQDKQTTLSGQKCPTCTVPEQSQHVHKNITMDYLNPIKSASCSSIDRLSLTSSLKEYAHNLEMVNSTTDESVGVGKTRERLLSVTRFETLSADLDTPQCATVVKVVDPVNSTSVSSRKEPRQRRPLLRRLHIRKKKNKGAQSVTESTPYDTNEVVMTPAGQAQIRRKKRKQGTQRMVVSDDLTHKVIYPKRGEDQKQSMSRQQDAPMHTNGLKKNENNKQKLEEQTAKIGKERLVLSAEHSFHNASAYFASEGNIDSVPTKFSQSMDGLTDLKILSIQLRKLAQPSQSTTNLDLSQRASETMSNVGLKLSYSMDNLTDPAPAPVCLNSVDTKEPPREGFLWRVLGRASQRWPALIHIVPIQNSQVGERGLCVRKGQQIRALYRVSSQVIVEMETNHLACIPYECCRISRKHYGPKSSLVQLSYSQLYAPVPDLMANNQTQLPTAQRVNDKATAPGPVRVLHAYTPIEMVAIQDCYDYLPLGEINVEAGDKLRVLYCGKQLVYAVKENGEAGVVARSICRLTRKSEKMYQKWVDLTGSPFQADFAVKFNEKPPVFLTNGVLDRYRVGSPTPLLEKRNTFSAGFLAKDEPQSSRSRSNTECSHLSSQCALQKPCMKPLPPTSPGNRKTHAPVSPLAHIGLKSPLSPSQPLSGLLHNTTTAAKPSLPPTHVQSPSHTKHSDKIPRGSEQISEAAKGSSEPPVNDIVPHTKPRSYSGKLMTVVQKYAPPLGSIDYTIRRGLRVRVIQSSPDGKTLRVATKTGTQFDIPASHLCMSRKNSEPSVFFGEHTANDVNNDIHSHVHQSTPDNHYKQGKAPTRNHTTPIPLECGKIMTVIRNYVPTAENMFTIRRGLRVKVVGQQGDLVKVVTKSGTEFCIPRSHLRPSHKSSNASSFLTTDTHTTESLPNNSPSHSSSKQVNTEVTEPLYHDLRSDNPHHVYATIRNLTPTRTAPPRRHTYSSTNEMSQTQFATNGGTWHAAVVPQTAGRGCRVNSTGSQVFQLC